MVRPARQKREMEEGGMERCEGWVQTDDGSGKVHRWGEEESEQKKKKAFILSSQTGPINI